MYSPTAACRSWRHLHCVRQGSELSSLAATFIMHSHEQTKQADGASRRSQVSRIVAPITHPPPFHSYAFPLFPPISTRATHFYYVWVIQSFNPSVLLFDSTFPYPVARVPVRCSQGCRVHGGQQRLQFQIQIQIQIQIQNQLEAFEGEGEFKGLDLPALSGPSGSNGSNIIGGDADIIGVNTGVTAGEVLTLPPFPPPPPPPPSFESESSAPSASSSLSVLKLTLPLTKKVVPAEQYERAKEPKHEQVHQTTINKQSRRKSLCCYVSTPNVCDCCSSSSLNWDSP